MSEYTRSDRVSKVGGSQLPVIGSEARRALTLYENCAHGGTFADRRFGKDVMAFLKAEHPAPR
jgi:hypothetical protein